MIPNARFPNTANWHTAKTTPGREELRANNKGMLFRCWAKKGKGAKLAGEGAPTKDYSITLRTDEPCVVDIDTDDIVEFDGTSYIVVGLEEMRSSYRLGAFEYNIYLR